MQKAFVKVPIVLKANSSYHQASTSNSPTGGRIKAILSNQRQMIQRRSNIPVLACTNLYTIYFTHAFQQFQQLPTFSAAAKQRRFAECLCDMNWLVESNNVFLNMQSQTGSCFWEFKAGNGQFYRHNIKRFFVRNPLFGFQLYQCHIIPSSCVIVFRANLIIG
jgi:hypothetical protein